MSADAGQSGTPIAKPEPSPAQAARTRIVRVGTWMLVPPSGADPEEVAGQLVEALKKDTRVISADLPAFNEHWTNKVRMFPDAPRTTSGQVITGSDAFKALQLAEGITFEVRVPKKNQPLHGGYDDIPSDTYYVAWNGVGAYVLWEQEGKHAPMSGGHVVADVLRDVTAQIGCELYVQSCSPGCAFMFVHRPIRLVDDVGVDLYELEWLESDAALEMSIPSDPTSPGRDAGYVGAMLGAAVDDFAEFKNLGRRMIDIEDELRADLAHVLHHFHQHAQLVADGPVKNLKARWAGRAWRSEARGLVARIWLGIANIETLRREWEERRSTLATHGIDPLDLFDSDFASDVESVQALHLEPVAEMVNQLAGGLDNRMVGAATAWGAIAGGLAGGLAGRLG